MPHYQVFERGPLYCKDERRTRFCIVSIIKACKPGSKVHEKATRWLADFDARGMPDLQTRTVIEAHYWGTVLKRGQYHRNSPVNL